MERKTAMVTSLRLWWCLEAVGGTCDPLLGPGGRSLETKSKAFQHEKVQGLSEAFLFRRICFSFRP